MKYTDKPDFGPLSNVRVVLAGLSTAGPFAATMMSDFGADVISIESPFVRDQYRTTDSLAYLNKERRNQRAIALNVVKPEGQEAFLKIIESADIFIENSRAGTWDKRGLSDEVLWEHNPKLVICHITGFGLTGDPEYLARGSYDSIGQALSGFMALNGEPDGAPMQAPAYAGSRLSVRLRGRHLGFLVLPRLLHQGAGDRRGRVHRLRPVRGHDAVQLLLADGLVPVSP